MVERGWLLVSGANFEVRPEGATEFASLGIETCAAQKSKRAFALVCEDWSERRPHLAGALGAAVLTRLEALGWIRRLPHSRAVKVTPAGFQGMKELLGYRHPQEV
jgi:hypothetical protein